MVVRIAVNVLRASVLLALILGILFWTGNATSLVLVHMGLGILAVLSLWTLGAAIASTKGGIGLAIGAFVWGILVAALGLTQRTLLNARMKLATPSAQLKHQDKIAGRRLLPTPLAVLILGALLLASIFLAVSFVTIAIPVGTIDQILLNGTGIFHFARHWDPTAEKIVWQVRMPIVIGAACVGAALSTAGVLFQGM